MGSRDRVLFELPLEHQKKPFNSEEKNPKDQALQEEWGGSLKNFFLDVPRNLVNGL